MSRKRIAMALAAAALLALPACGQYDGVHDDFVEAGGENPGLGGEDGTGADGTDSSGDGSGGGTGGETDDGGGGGGGGGGNDNGNAGNGDTTGVTDSTITIGIHAPLTGAAPLRQDSFETGKDLYWQYGNGGQPVEIFGRTVETVFADDQYRPSTARQVCQTMAEEQKAFALIGAGGTDQIQACAQYAASEDVPYLSTGVTETGMGSLDTYFAASMTYHQQTPMLAEYIKNELGVTDPSRVAAVVTNTPNFDDAVEGFTDAFGDVDVFRPDKNERGSSAAGNLCTGTVGNYDAVFVLTSPTFYLEMAAASGCRPQFVGVGVSMGLDQVASTGCSAASSTEGARFFNPTPAFADAGEYDPDFLAAVDAAGIEADDVTWMMWGQSKVLHQMLEKAGENLDRGAFLDAVAGSSFSTGVFPDLNYKNGPFGATQVSVLRNVCDGGGHYETDFAFVDGF
ncbi:ABC transporter substrate-binding protein [Glycomyces artemisiae]|uniref:ABC-type branched-subunit amino acid transport system substrate-binding protein n=1 Tax=Glycomyces artemisiae TaxID=1076443 RepID=A0A2T0U6A4_9ACTN|nr:ABC transporter substrate-binding protein [Glycomyces artemisiae]PRY53440.1 ABC-type branched-subunit amino acid transport system substrate-binding protein [Glycomyces artemisiae]